jgi:hypothetical protein
MGDKPDQTQAITALLVVYCFDWFDARGEAGGMVAGQGR